MNKPLTILQQRYGYDHFRDQQADIVDHVIAGNHAFVLMPTGGGKSLCYQIPAMCRKGVGIVVSPLIALMQDQIAALDQLGISAGAINSAMPWNQVREYKDKMRNGSLDLLYVAPERLVMLEFLELLDECEISLFAIDEAHCMSQWGKVRSVDLGGIGYGFLVNDQGTILIHPETDLTLKPIAEAFPESTPTVQEGMDDVLNGSGDQIFTFFKVEGLPAVSCYLGFAIDRNLAYLSLTNFRQTSVITAIIAVLAIMGLLGILVRQWVSRPVLSMTDAMTRLARGDLSVEVPGTELKDEIGSMAAAVVVFKDNAIEMERLAKENEAATKRLAEERRRALNQMADSFEKNVLSIFDTVAYASGQTQHVAKQLTASAEESNARAAAVSKAAAETTESVQTVASANEELSAAIREIAAQVTQSIQVASMAVDGVNNTSQTITELADAAERIGKVVGLIQDIAGQTNLLALNATIEAARAGDAGKGFAVVAGEVKSLANQTDKATGDIQTQVDGIQSSSTRSVTEIGDITTTIERINEFCNAIAVAVEQQGAATQEIADSVQRAASGTQDVSRNVSAVSDAFTMVSDEARALLQSSNEMQALAGKLRQEVIGFLKTVSR